MHGPDPACDGCLGTRRCWICLGTGVVDRRHGGVDACARCYGSGKCAMCQPVTVIDLGSPFGVEAPGEVDGATEAG